MARAAEDLYAALGIDRDAAPADIQKAYRKASKKAHPDMAGGSPEKFALVRRAVETLSDQARRKHYDETGEIEGKPVDNAQAEAMNLVAAAIEQVISTCGHKGIDAVSVDIVADAQRIVGARIDEIKQALRKPTNQLAAAKKLLGRFKRKNGLPNLIEPVMQARVASFQQHITALDRQLVCAKNAAQMLDGYTFKWDVGGDSRPPAAYGMNEMMAAAMRGY